MAVGQVSFHDDRKVSLSQHALRFPPLSSPNCEADYVHPTLQVKRVLVHQRENAIINRLNKTKVEKHPDLKQEKDDRQKELRKKDQAVQQARVCDNSLVSSSPFLRPPVKCWYVSLLILVLRQKKAAEKQKKEWEQIKYQKDHAYDVWNDDEAMAQASNQNRDEDWEDDFM